MSPHTPVTFLTGGTGLLGSHIGAQLLKNHTKTYFLTRPNHRMTAAGRLQAILDWHHIDLSLRANAHLIEGLPSKPISGIDRIIHCASDTSFSERHRRRVLSANVDFLEDLLDFAIRSRIPSFIHISTAYAAGRRSGPCPEEPITNDRFHNVYEESKAAAERLLLDRCPSANIRLTIVRPSIVYGHSRTGRTFRFNALYYPVKTALLLRKIFVEDIRERGGVRAAKAGVALEPDGTTRLPLRIEVHEKGGVNLIPVDFFTDAFFAILQSSPDGGIYHIVNPGQTRIEDIIGYAQDHFKLKGIKAAAPEEFRSKPPTSLEQLYARYLEAYSPYIKDTRLFLTSKIDSILKPLKITCPPYDKNMFHLSMSYAVEHDWRVIARPPSVIANEVKQSPSSRGNLPPKKG